MNDASAHRLKLRVGDLVEVRSEQEILATLDERGGIDGMPFMPEMLEFCGKRFRVFKRANKTCDPVGFTGSRRIYDTVHLEELRCGGSAHDGCQARCLLFWKESWLKRVDETAAARDPLPAEQTGQPSASGPCDRQRLFELTRQQDDANENATRYRCQNTDLPLASEQLSRHDLLQYFRELASGNVRVLEMVHAFLFFCFRKLLGFGVGYRALIWTFNRVQLWRDGTPYPFLHGQLDSTPRETLDLQPGELVQVKLYKEILETLNKTNHNRGLRFDPEMVQYCGSVQRVLARIDHIINERTGNMVRISSDCIMLEGTVCRAKFSENRTFCPRRAHAYWREIWLKRLKETQVPGKG